MRQRRNPEQKGLLDVRGLPDTSFDAQWESVILPVSTKDRLLSQGVLNFVARAKMQSVALPMHGIILLVGPPGTGKTSVARGLASRVASALKGQNFTFLEVEPHALASASLGKSQQAVTHLLGTVVAEQAASGPCIVLLDEVETLAADRRQMSLDANPIDVHRATDAVLAQLDQLAANHPNLLFVATSNFPGAIDDAFLSRADLIATIDLPSTEACKAILLDTIERLGRVYPKIAALKGHAAVGKAAEHCVGLDGRRIRKAVVAALAHSKEIALAPEQLTADAVFAAIQQAKAEAAALRKETKR